MRVLKLLHILAVTALFGLCAHLYYVPYFGLQNTPAYLFAASFLYLVLTVLLGRIYRAYTVGTSRIRDLVYSQGLMLLLADGISYVATCVMKLRFTNPLPLLLLFAVQIVWTVLWSFAANRLYFRINSPRATAMIYSDAHDRQKMEEVKHFDRKFNVVKYIQADEDTESMLQKLADVDVVFLGSLENGARNAVMKYCISNELQCYLRPRVGDVLVAGAEHMEAFSVPMLRIQKAAPTIEYLFIKRLFDIVVSLAAIIVASPFMIATALAVKLYDGGPVLYKQVRLTKDGEAFKVLKFRSMRTDAEKDGVARLSTAHDDRITPIGKFIRAIRFDELPQLFNILLGDMSIVGPRPERPEIAEQYEKEIPSFGLRLQVKAGLTGYAQVYGRYNTEPYDKLKMDLMYINRMSLIEDLRIIFATVKILFMKESTEGIEDGQTTASHKEAEEKEAVGVK